MRREDSGGKGGLLREDRGEGERGQRCLGMAGCVDSERVSQKASYSLVKAHRALRDEIKKKRDEGRGRCDGEM